MTIALVLPNPPQYSEHFLAQKIAFLRAKGFDVMVMVVGAAQLKPNVDYPIYYQPILAASGTRRWVHSLYLMGVSALRYPKRVGRLLREAKQIGYTSIGAWRLVAVLSNFLKIKTDWVHFAYGTMAVERALIGRVIGAKVGVSFRGYDVCIAPISNPNMYENVWPYVDKVHCISNDIRNAALKSGLPTTIPMHIIYPAISLADFTATESYPPNEIPQIITVARLHWKKGLEYTLEALAVLAQKGIAFHYTIVGDGRDYERLKFAAHQLGVSDRVTFLGKVAHDDIPTLLRKSDVYVQYSIQEGFCNAVLEAQAAGLLCVVSDAEGLSENVLHEQTGWVVPKRRPELLAEQINAVMALSDGEKNTIRKAAEARVREAFNLEKQADAFGEFFCYAEDTEFF